MNSLTAIPDQVRADATSLLLYVGQPTTPVVWSLTGSGSLHVLDDMTDGAGRAAAIYTPGTVGATVTITATGAT